MKFKIEELYELSHALDELADKELPISMAFAVQRNRKIISEELVASDKLRQKIIDEHKEKQYDDGSVKIKKSDMEIFKRKTLELLQQEVDLEIAKGIKLEDLEKMNITIKPRTLIALDLIAD